ncbi:hypothetical protein ACIQNG_14805 [Streptomyces sp. NPDC091377]|uniref:hypothetical protein n=1 Tax=Streptomyces sp. NPDC091377 TaxID=3365995 RepID=UPI0037F4FBF3
MTITEDGPVVRKAGPAGQARGFVTAGVTGATLAALVLGTVVENVPLFVAGLVLPLAYGALLVVAGKPARAREAAVERRTTLARVESVRAVGEGAGDVPVRFDLTVVPDDGRPYRVAIREQVNLVDLPDYRPGRIVVVEYAPERLWRVALVRRPSAEWEERAAGAGIDSAPESEWVREPSRGGVFWPVGIAGFVVGAAVVIGLVRGELSDGESRPDWDGTPSYSTSVSSSSATLTVERDASLRDEGELRWAVESLAEAVEGPQRRATSVVVQEHTVAILYAAAGTKAPGFDPYALPFDRIPALVEEAGTSLGTGSPESWQLTADGLTEALKIRVSVTGPKGAASLEADERGEVVRRDPVR